ncbi:MAG: type IX secretion system sortase PorU [Bacteroidia bacterium]|nr:type IX secretion system sortase PorU [Bacteroidia bacterium]
MKYRIIQFLVLPVLFAMTHLAHGQNSPLSEGKWYQLNVVENGIYKVDFQDFLNMGFSASELEANKIQIFSHHGGMLPELIDTRPLGLREISIEVVDDGNNKIDGNDYVLFYGESPDKWELNGTDYRHIKNIYSDASNYFITIGSNTGKRISNVPSLTNRPTAVYTESDYVWFHDLDLVNPAHMGRSWAGEPIGLNSNSLNLTFNLPSNLKDSAEIRTQIFNVTNVSNSTLKYSINGATRNAYLVPINKDSYEYIKHFQSFNSNISAKKIDFSLDIIKSNNQSHAFLDYIELETEQDLQQIDGFTLIRQREASKHNEVEFAFSGVSNDHKVWNLEDLFNIRSLNINTSGASGYVNYKNDFKRSKLALFSSADLKKPIFQGAVANQNISAEEPKELIIIYPEEYASVAEELKNYKESKGLSTKIVTPAKIYKEFSTGQQDITAIRDYLRNEYLKTGANGEKLTYVLLLGSTSYDPKNRLQNNTNRIPNYISPYHQKTSNFVTDDFFAYTAQGSGVPNTSNNLNKMSFAVGRIPARKIEEAQIFVDKLKRYKSPSSLGPWRTNIAFVSDDIDESFERDFHFDSEFAAAKLDVQHPQFEVNKIYMDAYKQRSTGNKEEYPDVQRDLNFNVQNGCLFMNYIGHGGERGWAQESILDIPTINGWKQPNGNYPIFFTATCEFSRNDDPSIQSGGELTLFNPDGGSIAMLTTTRLVWVSGNSIINRSFWDKDGFPDWNETDKSLGSIYKKLKNRPSVTSEDMKFSLLGDPSMTPNFPENNIVLDSINGTYILSSTDTLKAFSLATLKGHVTDKTNSKMGDFNGELWATIYDKVNQLKTLNNDNVGGEMPYSLRNSVVFKGKVDVVNGDFTLRFVIPKDIAYNIGSGRIYLYAHNTITDAAGVRDILVGSSIDNKNTDDDGPIITPLMNDYSFKNGDIVNKNSTILGKISDISGINSTGNGIGRNITAIIDEGTPNEQTFNLNNYFTYDKNSFSQGEVRFPVENITVGKHQLKLKAWDIYNNLGSAVTSFEVVDDQRLIVSEHQPFPNPFWNTVQFNIKHNYAGQDLNAQLFILNNLGAIVSENNVSLKNTRHVDSQLIWDGRTQSRGAVSAGIYFYKVILSSPNGATTSFSGKVVKKN